MVVAGAGPAGLTAAYALTKRQISVVVAESSAMVGGIARTESYKGYRFDIGGHRFFTKVKPVQSLWEEVCGDDFIDVPRMSRIYYRGQFFDYPLKLSNTLSNLGVFESTWIMLSYLKWQIRPSREEETFEQWVRNRFGGRLYWHFFRTYTEKVWGIPCSEIRADWAAQRIKNLSLKKAIWNAVSGSNDTTSLINSFKYPRLGPGMMWEKFRDRTVEQGGEMRMKTEVTGITIEDNRVQSVTLTDEEGDQVLSPEHLISTMALPQLIRQIKSAVPDRVREAAEGLKYRDFLIVTLILDCSDPFPDNWIYIHSPEVKVGRIQNFRSWSSEMVPDASTCSLGLEYFCHRGDNLWDAEDQSLIDLATKELEWLGLGMPDKVSDATVIRQAKAYPVYDSQYREHVETIRNYLDTIDNLHVAGRNGMHRYNNQDHSMLTAMMVAENICGANHNVWDVNVERSYHEDFVVDKKSRRQGGRDETRVAVQ